MAGGFGLKRLWAHITYDRSIGFGLEYIGLTTLRYPKAVAIGVLLFSILCFSQIPKANVDGDLLRVYANSGHYYDAYERLADTFGTFENDIYVLVNSPHLTDPVVLEQVRNLAFDLELNDFAVGTMSPFTLRKPDGGGGTVPAVPEGMTDFAQVALALTDLQQNDPMMRNLITPDLTGMVLIMFSNPCQLSTHPQTTCDANSLLPEDQRSTKAMIQSLRDTIAPYQSADLSVELTGPPVWTSEMLSASISDQARFTVYGFVIGAIIALVALRSFWGAIIVAATPFMAVLWSMGFILLLFGSFSFLTIIVTTLVLVICFAESTFFVFSWMNYWRDGMDPNKAVDEAVHLIGPATALTTLTTMLSFASLSLTPGQGIKEFAIAGILGCALLFVAIMTFLPLMLKLAIRLGFKLPKPSNLLLTAPLPLAWFLTHRFGRLVAIVSIATTVLFFIPYFLIQPRFSFQDFVATGSSALTAAESIDDGVGGVAPFYIRVPLVEHNPNLGATDFATVKKVHEILEARLGNNKVISAASMTDYTDSGFTREEVFDAVGPFMKRRFITDDGSEALVTGFMPTIVESDALKALVRDTTQDLQDAGITGAEIGGFRVLTTFATDQIVSSMQLELTLSVVANLVLIGFAFQSFRVSLASAIPNFFPVLGTEAWLYFTGQGLQLTTVIALIIAFGIAVDDTVHFLAHYLHGRREEGLEHMDAIKHTIERIGGAIVATTIILCSGTAIVATSALPQVALFGSLFVLTLALALLGDLFILPSLLAAGGKFFHPLGKLRVRTADHDATPDDPSGNTKTDLPHPSRAN